MKDLAGKIGLVLSVCAIGWISYSNIGESEVSSFNIGVVQMDDLVYGYNGMKEATEKYTEKMGLWGAQSDTLKNKLQHVYNDMQEDSVNGNQQKLLSDQQKFMTLQSAYYEYQQKIQEVAQQEDQEMTIAVITQLKSHIKNYAKSNNFDLIITNNSQWETIGYTKQAIDLTNEIIDYANTIYEGEE